MTAMFQLDYVPNGMFNLFLGQLREHSHVLINPLRDDVYYDFYRIRPEIEEDYWACRAGRVNFDCYMCPVLPWRVVVPGELQGGQRKQKPPGTTRRTLSLLCTQHFFRRFVTLPFRGVNTICSAR